MDDPRKGLVFRPWAIISATWAGPAILAAIADLQGLRWEGGGWLRTARSPRRSSC